MLPLPTLKCYNRVGSVNQQLNFQTITLHFVLLQSKAEIDQYVEGVLDVIREHPGLLQSLFCKTEDTLTVI